MKLTKKQRLVFDVVKNSIATSTEEIVQHTGFSHASARCLLRALVKIGFINKISSYPSYYNIIDGFDAFGGDDFCKCGNSPIDVVDGVPLCYDCMIIDSKSDSFTRYEWFWCDMIIQSFEDLSEFDSGLDWNTAITFLFDDSYSYKGLSSYEILNMFGNADFYRKGVIDFVNKTFSNKKLARFNSILESIK